jgi:nickel/cobalt exporter
VALGGLYFGREWQSEESEAYLQIFSAILIVCVAVWMAWRTWQEQHEEHHHHHDETRRVEIGGSMFLVEIEESGVPARWHVAREGKPLTDADGVELHTMRPDGSRQAFSFRLKDGVLESVEEIPEPHEFSAVLSIRGHGPVTLGFEEHDHAHMNLGDEDDAHARAHAADIRNRFAGRTVTTWQIVLFGLTGGLIPCPAAITILLLCIQLKQFTLGFTLVLCFGTGLALTMVSAGVLAALSMRHIERRWTGFSHFARQAPYVSAALILLVGAYTGWLGVHAL